MPCPTLPARTLATAARWAGKISQSMALARKGLGMTAEIGHLPARLLAISHGAGKYRPPTALILPGKPSGADGGYRAGLGQRQGKLRPPTGFGISLGRGGGDGGAMGTKRPQTRNGWRRLQRPSLPA